MYRQNYRKFPLKKPSLIRTTDTKSQPLGANSYKINLFVTDTPGTNRGPGVDNLRYVPLTLSQTAIPIPEHVKMLVFKTYIYNCKYGNRKYCGNSQFNTYSVCSAVLYCNKWQSYECIMKNMYVTCETIYVNWRRNLDCSIVLQWVASLTISRVLRVTSSHWPL